MYTMQSTELSIPAIKYRIYNGSWLSHKPTKRRLTYKGLSEDVTSDKAIPSEIRTFLHSLTKQYRTIRWPITHCVSDIDSPLVSSLISEQVWVGGSGGGASAIRFCDLRKSV